MRTLVAGTILTALLVAGLSGCGDDGDDSNPATDAGQTDAGADSGSPDVSPPADAADVAADAGDPDLGPADVSAPDVAQLPDIYFPDLGPLDQGLRGCMIGGCPGSQRCDPEGTCQEPAVCALDVDCHGPRICLDGSCSAPCGSGLACVGSTWCHAPSGRCAEPLSCDEHSACLQGRICAGEPGRCGDPPSVPCGPAQPCAGGLVCGEWGLCEEPAACGGDGDCHPGRTCGVQADCANCRQPEDCSGSTTCQLTAGRLRCVEPAVCVTDDDCLPLRGCQGGRCQPAAECLGDALEPDDDEPAPAAARLYPRTLCPGDRDRVWIELAAGDGLVVVVRGIGAEDAAPGLDPLLILRDGRGSEIGRWDRPGPDEAAVYAVAPVDLTLELEVRAGQPEQQGEYTLDLQRVPGGVCADDAGEQHGGDDDRDHARRVGAGRLEGRLCGEDEDWLLVDVAEAGSRLVARLDATRMVGAPTLGLYTDGDVPVSQGQEISQDNLGPGSVRVRVAGGQGAYGLLLELAPPAALAQCAAAAALQPGVATAATGDPATLTATTCAAAPVAGARYQFDIAQPTAVELELTGGGANAGVELRALCAEPASALGCVVGAGTLTHPYLLPGRYTVIVRAGSDVAGEEFELALQVGAAIPPPGNDLCALARPIPLGDDGHARVGGNLDNAGDYAAPVGCSPPAGLADIFYTLRLDEPSLLVASTDGATAPWLALLGSCDRPVEFGCSTPQRRLLVNDLPAGDYLLVAQAEWEDGRDGSFTLDVRRQPVADADQCLGAIDVERGGYFDNDTTEFSSDYHLTGNGCTGAPSTGNDIAYTVWLEAGETLRASLESDWDGQIFLVTDCEEAEASCVAGVDEQPGGEAEVLEYQAQQAGRYFLIVDAWSRGEAGPFRLSVAINGECLRHRDCPDPQTRCIHFHCINPECAEDADCLEPGFRCQDQRCVPPECRDHAPCRDVGGYCIDLRCQVPGGDAVGSGQVDLAIPDGTPAGVVSAVDAPDLGAVGELLVEVWLTHPYQGDLLLELISPQGTRVRLHNQTGGGQAFYEELFGATRSADGPGRLADLTGEPSVGTWLLRAVDLASGDEGVLHGWALHLRPAAE